MTANNHLSELSDFSAKVGGTKQSGMRVAWAFFLASLAATFGIVGAGHADIDDKIFAGSLGLACLLFACLVVAANGKPLRTLFDLRLGAMFFGYAAVAYGLSTITILDPTWVSGQIVLSWIPGTLLLLAFAFLLAVIGYQTRSLSDLAGVPVRAFGRSFSSKRGTHPRSVPALYAVFILGVLTDLAIVALTGQYGYLGVTEVVSSDTTAWYVQPLGILSKAKFAAIFGLAIVALRSKTRGALAILAPAVIFAILLGLLTGMKESFFDVVLSVIIPWILIKKRIPIIATFIAGLIFVLVVTPFITQLRGDVRGTDVLSVQDGGKFAISQLFSLGTYLEGTDSEDSALQVASRIRLVDNAALIQAKTPAVIPYRDALEIVSAPVTGLIPRAVWPDKPIRLAGYDFYKTFYEGQGESSSAITPQGSLYMFGGVPVLLIGMFLIGVALRALDDSLNSIANPHSAILLVFFAPLVVKQEMDVPGFLASLPIMLLTWAVAIFLVFSPAKNAKMKS